MDLENINTSTTVTTQALSANSAIWIENGVPDNATVLLNKGFSLNPWSLSHQDAKLHLYDEVSQLPNLTQPFAFATTHTNRIYINGYYFGSVTFPHQFINKRFGISFKGRDLGGHTYDNSVESPADVFTGMFREKAIINKSPIVHITVPTTSAPTLLYSLSSQSIFTLNPLFSSTQIAQTSAIKSHAGFDVSMSDDGSIVAVAQLPVFVQTVVSPNPVFKQITPGSIQISKKVGNIWTPHGVVTLSGINLPPPFSYVNDSTISLPNAVAGSTTIKPSLNIIINSYADFNPYDKIELTGDGKRLFVSLRNHGAIHVYDNQLGTTWTRTAIISGFNPPGYSKSFTSTQWNLIDSFTYAASKNGKVVAIAIPFSTESGNVDESGTVRHQSCGRIETWKETTPNVWQRFGTYSRKNKASSRPGIIIGRFANNRLGGGVHTNSFPLTNHRSYYDHDRPFHTSLPQTIAINNNGTVIAAVAWGPTEIFNRPSEQYQEFDNANNAALTFQPQSMVEIFKYENSNDRWVCSQVLGRLEGLSYVGRGAYATGSISLDSAGTTLIVGNARDHTPIAYTARPRMLGYTPFTTYSNSTPLSSTDTNNTTSGRAAYGSFVGYRTVNGKFEPLGGHGGYNKASIYLDSLIDPDFPEPSTAWEQSPQYLRAVNFGHELKVSRDGKRVFVTAALPYYSNKIRPKPNLSVAIHPSTYVFEFDSISNSWVIVDDSFNTSHLVAYFGNFPRQNELQVIAPLSSTPENYFATWQAGMAFPMMSSLEISTVHTSLLNGKIATNSDGSFYIQGYPYASPNQFVLPPSQYSPLTGSIRIPWGERRFGLATIRQLSKNYSLPEGAGQDSRPTPTPAPTFAVPTPPPTSTPHPTPTPTTPPPTPVPTAPPVINREAIQVYTLQGPTANFAVPGSFGWAHYTKQTIIPGPAQLLGYQLIGSEVIGRTNTAGNYANNRIVIDGPTSSERFWSENYEETVYITHVNSSNPRLLTLPSTQVSFSGAIGSSHSTVTIDINSIVAITKNAPYVTPQTVWFPQPIPMNGISVASNLGKKAMLLIYYRV